MARIFSALAFLAGAQAAHAQFSWGTATPESQGMSTAKLDAMQTNLQSRATSHFLVIRNDKVVYEWYASGQSRTTNHYTASMAKALVGGVSLGLAIDDGLISLDDLATRFVPQWGGVARKSQIKVRHLGSHTSGVEDAEENNLPHDQLTGWKGDFWKRLAVPNDPFTISRDLAPCLETPGTLERYSNPGIAMLTYCVTGSLRNAPVKDIRTLLRDRVMRPIGVPDAEWNCGYGQTFTVDGLPLVPSWGGGNYSPNATARVARLMLKGGTWEGAELMNAAAVQAITSDAGTPGNGGQGWWTNSDGSGGTLPAGSYWGAGAGHQVVVVVPSLSLIAVRNGGTLDSTLSYDAALRTHFFDPLMAAVTSSQTSGAPYPPSAVITGIAWAPASSIVRKAPGCDTWPLTWADDDTLYGAYGDGNGFEPQLSVKLSLGLAKVSGAPPSITGSNIRSPTGEQTGDGASGKKASGMVMLDGVLYMWVRNADNNGNQSQLAWSADRAATWTWSSWKFAEFGYPTFINFGKNYAGARDAYVYAVSHDNPSAYNEADRFILMRVPAAQIKDKAAYEFFRGKDSAGNPLWTTDIAQRGAVFTHAGRCRRSGISYNAPLRRYLWWQMVHEDGVDNRFSGGFGVYDAPEPWGPWTTVYFTRSWDVGPGETGSFPPKWMSADGKTIHLVFSGDDKFSVRQAALTVSTAGSNASPNVTITSPTAGSAFTAPATITIQATASDPDGTVSRVEFWSGGSLLGSDTSGPYSFTWNNVSSGSYSLTARAVDDQGATATSAAVNISVTSAAGGLISNISAASGQAYERDLLDVGKTQYVDRAFTFNAVPASFAGLEYIRTANDDKGSSGSAFLSFDLAQDATVTVAHDDRFATKPPWMAGFADTGEDLVSGAGTFSLWGRDYVSGTVTLGGNTGDGVAQNSMYTVAARPRSGPPPADRDGDGMSDAFELTHGFDPDSPDQDGNRTPDGQDDWDLDGTANASDSSPGSPPAPAGATGGGGGCGATGAEALLLVALLALGRAVR
jgi:hypothetical protein